MSLLLTPGVASVNKPTIITPRAFACYFYYDSGVSKTLCSLDKLGNIINNSDLGNNCTGAEFGSTPIPRQNVGASPLLFFYSRKHGRYARLFYPETEAVLNVHTFQLDTGPQSDSYFPIVGKPLDNIAVYYSNTSKNIKRIFLPDFAFYDSKQLDTYEPTVDSVQDLVGNCDMSPSMMIMIGWKQSVYYEHKKYTALNGSRTPVRSLAYLPYPLGAIGDDVYAYGLNSIYKNGSAIITSGSSIVAVGLFKNVDMFGNNFNLIVWLVTDDGYSLYLKVMNADTLSVLVQTPSIFTCTGQKIQSSMGWGRIGYDGEHFYAGINLRSDTDLKYKTMFLKFTFYSMVIAKYLNTTGINASNNRLYFMNDLG